MRAVILRTNEASVTVEGQVTGQIQHGLLVLLGVTHEDTERDAKFLADKIAGLRIFEDGEAKMNLSVADTGGQVLSISQFTLYGDARKGRRPNFMAAARPEQAGLLYEQFNGFLRAAGLEVATGVFGAMMDVQLVNSGPVTILVDSKD